MVKFVVDRPAILRFSRILAAFCKDKGSTKQVYIAIIIEINVHFLYFVIHYNAMEEAKYPVLIDCHKLITVPNL